MSAQHSPGPWSIMGREDSDGKWRDLEVVQEQMPFMRVCFLTSDGPNEVNARLIAAAPTMYDYIALRASSGDLQAKQILEGIHVSR